MTEALYRLGMKNSLLISTVCDDISGRYIREESRKIGMNVSQLHTITKKSVTTGTYCAVFHASGEINVALGNMRAHDFITPELIQQNLSTLADSEFCVIDADIPSETISFICTYCENNNIPVWFNPTDLRKCYKLIEANSLSKITYISPNIKELFTIFRLTLQADKSLDLDEKKDLNTIFLKYKESVNQLEHFQFDELKKCLKYLLKFVPFIVLTRGSKELILASAFELTPNAKRQLPSKSSMSSIKKAAFKPQLLLYPVAELKENERISNVSGAGDSTSSGIICGILKDLSLNAIIYNGLAAAKLTLMSDRTVSEQLDSLGLDLVEGLVAENQSNIKTFLL